MVKLVDLVTRGYFPKELPPPFSTKTLGELVRRNPSLSLYSLGGPREFRLARHSLFRAGTLRRQLAVPNPVPFIELAQSLASNWTEVEKQCQKSSISLSKLGIASTDRAVVAKVPFSERSFHQASLRASSRYLLKADVANFYPSVYTHSISWALHTKAIAKARRRTRGLLGNKMDKLVRDGQHGQTMGIPVGPDTSFVIAEMLLSSVDEAFCSMLRKQKLETNGYRSYDDFEFGFATRADAESAAALLQQAMSEYELQLNANKTAIVELPMPLEPTWVSEIRMFRFTDNPSSWDINRYFDRAFELSTLHSDSNVLKYAIQRLRSVEVAGNVWSLLENHLLHCAMVEPSCLPAVVDHLHYYKNQGFLLNLVRVEKVLNILMKLHVPLSHGSEVAWALWGCLLFHLSIDEDISAAIIRMEDPFVSLLLLHAQDMGLTKKKIGNSQWRKYSNIKSLREEVWPLAYEANIQGWITTKSDYVSKDSTFSFLKASKVSFYDINKVNTHTPSKRVHFTWSSGGGTYPD